VKRVLVQFSFTFNESEINDKIAEVQAGNEVQYYLYGDRIYQFESHVRRAHMGDDEDLSPLEIQENKVMTKIRIAVEWAFGVTSKLFKLNGTRNVRHIRKHGGRRTCKRT
jgi:hypothetical protein